MVGLPERLCPEISRRTWSSEDGAATIVYNGYGYFDTSELTWGIGNRMYSDDERIAVRSALRNGTVDAEAAKEGMRFGAGTADATSHGSGLAAPANDQWFGIVVASCERGDIRQSPRGLYVYGEAGRREVPVTGELYGIADIREMHEWLTEGKRVTHDGRWALATLEIGTAIVQSGRERREIMLEHQSSLR